MNCKHGWEFMADETTDSYGAYCPICDEELTAEQVSSTLNQAAELLEALRQISETDGSSTKDAVNMMDIATEAIRKAK